MQIEALVKIFTNNLSSDR